MDLKELLKIAKPLNVQDWEAEAIFNNEKNVIRKVVKYYGKTPDMHGKDNFYKIDENLNGENPNKLCAGFYNKDDILKTKEKTIIDALYFPLNFKTGDIVYVREPYRKLDSALANVDINEYIYKGTENGRAWEENIEN